jgi:hypothetical protein
MGECDVGRVNSGLSFSSLLFSSLLGLFCVCVFPLACVGSFSIMAFYWVNLLPPNHPILVLTFAYVYFQSGVGYLILELTLNFGFWQLLFFSKNCPGGWVSVRVFHNFVLGRYIRSGLQRVFWVQYLIPALVLVISYFNFLLPLPAKEKKKNWGLFCSYGRSHLIGCLEILFLICVQASHFVFG